jgi:VanZ family protein
MVSQSNRAAAGRNLTTFSTILALLAWTLVFAYSLAPFDFSRYPVADAERDAVNESSFSSSVDLGLHALAFVAVGLVTRLASSASSHRQPVIMTMPFIRAAAFSVAIEIAQIFLPSRHPAIHDLVINVAGWIAGHTIAGMLLASGTRPRNPGWCTRRSARVVMLCVWCLFWSAVAILPTRWTRLDGWDRSYPLLIGKEKEAADEEGFWEGSVQYVALYDRALEPEDVRAAFSRRPGQSEVTASRDRLGLLVAYDFTRPDRSTIEPEGRLGSPDLRLRVPTGGEWAASRPSSLALGRLVLLETRGAATPITDAIALSGEFSVEIWCRPASLAQSGPRRLVSISDGIWSRNFTLAQEQDELRFRVRNQLNGPNGLAFELQAPHALSAELQQIVATYEHGVSVAYRDGARLSTQADLRQPAVLLGLGPSARGTSAAMLFAVLSLALVIRSTAP